MPRPREAACRKRRPFSSRIEYTGRPASFRGFQPGGNSPIFPFEKSSMVTHIAAPTAGSPWTAGSAEDEDGGLAVERLQLGPAEAAEGVAEVRPAVVVHRGGLERPLDGPVHRVGVEGLRDLGDLGDEDVGAHP